MGHGKGKTVEVRETEFVSDLKILPINGSRVFVIVAAFELGSDEVDIGECVERAVDTLREVGSAEITKQGYITRDWNKLVDDDFKHIS